jgi:hypothetical protein
MSHRSNPERKKQPRLITMIVKAKELYTVHQYYLLFIER